MCVIWWKSYVIKLSNITHETEHFSLIAPKVPLFTAQKNNNVLTLKKIFGREKKANIGGAKYLDGRKKQILGMQNIWTEKKANIGGAKYLDGRKKQILRMQNIWTEEKSKYWGCKIFGREKKANIGDAKYLDGRKKQILGM
jgi:hypothetical protein